MKREQLGVDGEEEGRENPGFITLKRGLITLKSVWDARCYRQRAVAA